jgi:cobalt-zinc-cadmium efflux system membrane fusion protein
MGRAMTGFKVRGALFRPRASGHLARQSRLGAGLVVALVIVCGGCEQKSHEGEHDAEHSESHEEADPHPALPNNLVRVERSMLRDLRITTRAAESRPASDSVTVLGELRINEDAYAEVGTSIPARVSRVMAAPGDVVKAGQALVELDSPEVGRARALLSTSRTERDLARKVAERRRGLSAEQIVPEREREAADADLARAEAENRAAGESLDALGAARGQGARFLLTTPIAGTVVDRTALLGSMASAERPLFIVGDLSRLWLVVHAFERDALRMRTGTSARVSFPALPAQPASGSVTRIGSRVEVSSRTIDVRIEIDNPTGVLRPGMSATALVPLGDSTDMVVAVPVEALQRQAEGWCVFLPKAEEGVFEIRAVGRGRDLGSEVEVLSGLHAGEPVVNDGAFLLKAEADKARGGSDEHHH